MASKEALEALGRQLEALRLDSDKRFQALEERNERSADKIRALEQDNTTLRRQKQEHDEEIRALREEHDEKIRALREEHDEKIRALREEHNEEIRALREEHNEEIRALREEHDEEIRALREEHDEEIRALREEHDEKTRALNVSELTKQIVGNLRFGYFDDLCSTFLQLPKAPAVFRQNVCLAFLQAAQNLPADKHCKKGHNREKAFDLEGCKVKSGLVERSHLVPNSAACRIDWGIIVQNALPEGLRSDDVAKKVLFGCCDEDNNHIPGIADLPFNFIFLGGQREHLESKAALMLLPLLSPQQQFEWKGEGYKAILIGVDKDVYRQTFFQLDTEAVLKNSEYQQHHLDEESLVKEICRPMKQKYLLPTLYQDDREVLHQALQHIQILYKDVCLIQCEAPKSLETLLQDNGYWNQVSRCFQIRKVSGCDDLRDKLRKQKKVKAFEGLKSETGQPVAVALPCFRVITFKGDSQEEQHIELHTAPHPLLLSLRSMNAMANYFYGDLPNGRSSLLLMSCYGGLEEGMAFDCELCLRNAFGEEFDPQEQYVMGPDGPEILSSGNPVQGAARSPDSQNSPEALQYAAERQCGSNTSASPPSSQESECSAASTVQRDVFEDQ
ncbi:hypothetical protein GUITHDRAFT_104740 [Guillardia theta CCMP2712]|uniref:Uncharacterized protein n=1 Tax=Guillardia theta (strain CCMP2712) TaxID=905079 RepID=L1JMH3_GUITC|nr:hypothetical protein GUITHDRAFT_104740 [Guillardia theta CCMP2712]EKX49776.1 hypothetical protein GUITHDRAFT_104740 [Guillardia theta CCMP2712]|eukprot:XP_005836756.1 hypothetical protein GUITHDRAFT_104740 [Guillardia theta CCMP2712]